MITEMLIPLLLLCTLLFCGFIINVVLLIDDEYDKKSLNLAMVHSIYLSIILIFTGIMYALLNGSLSVSIASILILIDLFILFTILFYFLIKKDYGFKVK